MITTAFVVILGVLAVYFGFRAVGVLQIYLWSMIWDTLIWRPECSNRWRIRLAQKCYLCLRYVL